MKKKETLKESAFDFERKSFFLQTVATIQLVLKK